MSQYDDFADIHDVWVASVPALTDANRRFYVERYVETEGPVVELGVGTGRIAIEAAVRGKPVIGVDDSPAMLELCRERAAAAGVGERITLHQDDFRGFRLDEPAALITIPFHTIGHMLSLDDKRACLTHARGQLAPGGRLIFDHFVPDPVYLQRSGQPVLRTVTTDELDAEGVVARRRVRRVETSWIEPEQSRALLQETGFAVETAYGDFDGAPLGDGSRSQIWIARRT